MGAFCGNVHHIRQFSSTDSWKHLISRCINTMSQSVIILSKPFKYYLLYNWKLYSNILNNLFFQAYRCMYVVLIMAIYWVLELLPLPVTSMLPIVLFPTMGILDSDKTCAAYMKETNMMFMGGLMIAAGVQHSKLPKRVALWTVQVVGCSHRR